MPTVPPQIAAKTRQKHDYPPAAHRRSHARRTAAERTFSTAKDPASNNIARGWCRLTGLTPLMLWLACLLAVRNQRILIAWHTRQAGNARRAAAGLPPKTRRRRRTTIADLTAAPPLPSGPDHPARTNTCREHPRHHRAPTGQHQHARNPPGLTTSHQEYTKQAQHQRQPAPGHDAKPECQTQT